MDFPITHSYRVEDFLEGVLCLVGLCHYVLGYLVQDVVEFYLIFVFV